jgi:hypothetical protein
MTPRARAESIWYRTAGLASRNQKDLAVEIIEAEIRSAQHEVLLEAAKLVLSGEPIEIARQLRDRAAHDQAEQVSDMSSFGKPLSLVKPDPASQRAAELCHTRDAQAYGV